MTTRGSHGADNITSVRILLQTITKIHYCRKLLPISCGEGFVQHITGLFKLPFWEDPSPIMVIQ